MSIPAMARKQMSFIMEAYFHFVNASRRQLPALIVFNFTLSRAFYHIV
jgi:hypothetical protein